MERTLSLQVDGAAIAFKITAKFQGNERKLNDTGKVTGADSMELKSSIVGGGQGFEWKVKRVE